MILKVCAFTLALNFIELCSCTDEGPSMLERMESFNLSVEELEKRAMKSYEDKDYEKTILYCSRLIYKNKKEDSYYKLRGKCRARRGYIKKALSDFVKAKNLNPNNPDHRALYCESGGEEQYKKQFASYGRILLAKNNYKDAIRCFTKALEKYPSDVINYAFRASCYIKIKEFDLALADIGFTPDNQQKFSSLVELTQALFDSGKYEEAIEQTGSWGSTEDFIELGNKFFSMEKFDEALLAYTQALLRDPQTKNFKIRAKCYLYKDDRESALADFEKAAQKDGNVPDSAKKGYGRALLSLAMLKYGKTEEAYQEIGYLDCIHILMIGDELLKKEDFETSFLYYSEAIRRYPRNAECYWKLARYYWKRRDFDEAINNFHTAIQMEPSTLVFSIDLVNVLLDAEKLDDGKTTVESVIKKFGDQDTALYEKEIRDIYSRIEKMEELERIKKLKAHDISSEAE